MPWSRAGSPVLPTGEGPHEADLTSPSRVLEVSAALQEGRKRAFLDQVPHAPLVYDGDDR